MTKKECALCENLIDFEGIYLPLYDKEFKNYDSYMCGSCMRGYYPGIRKKMEDSIKIQQILENICYLLGG